MVVDAMFDCVYGLRHYIAMSLYHQFAYHVMATQEEWIQVVRDKLGTDNFVTKLTCDTGIAVVVLDGKCPECGEEQRALYTLPHDATTYQSFEHEPSGVPKSR